VVTVALNGGRHAWATTRKADAIFCRFAFELLFFFAKWKCFLNKSVSAYETRIRLFSKRKCFCLENICKAKVFLKRKENVFKTKRF